MHKLIEKLSLAQQMYLQAGFATVWLALTALLTAVPPAGADVRQQVVVMAALGVGFLFVFAYLCGRVAGKRAEAVVFGLKALASGNLGHSLSLSGRDEFAWMAFEYQAARKKLSLLVADTLQGSHRCKQVPCDPPARLARTCRRRHATDVDHGR
jgi:hypothetical protein